MPLTNIEIETMTMVKAACRKYTEENNRVAPIDWEQRRYEIAKDMMSATFFGGNNGSPSYWQREDPNYAKTMAQYAVIFADALIAELKK